MEWAAHVIPLNPDQDAPENGRPGVQNGASKTVVLKDALPPPIFFSLSSLGPTCEGWLGALSVLN